MGSIEVFVQVEEKIEEVGELAIKSDGKHKKVAKLDIYADTKGRIHIFYQQLGSY